MRKACFQRRLALIAAILLAAAWVSWPQSDDRGSQEGSAVSEEALTEWREVLLYGIDDEVLEVIGQIRSAGARSLDAELLSVLGESLHVGVRREILGLFQAQGDDSAEGIALELLAGYEDMPREMITALISYLAAVGSQDSRSLLRELVDHEEVIIASEAVRALGKLRSEEAVLEDDPLDLFLLEKLDDDDVDDRLKPDIVLALGELKSEGSVEPLIAILEDREEDKGMRMYAAEALGRIGDDRAVPALKELLQEQDALLKAYAASALSYFPQEDVRAVLIQALKDANWRVRVTAVKSLANPDSASALDILMYKARKDPVTAVRTEAVKALGEIGKKEGYDLLRELYADEGQSLDVRTSCLDVLVEKDLGNSLESLWKVVEEHLGKPMFQSKILDYTAKKLAETEGMAIKGVLQRLLDAESPLVRISGIRGIALNRYTSLRQRLERIAEEDPHPGVRKEAASALEQW